ncbi:MAG: HIT family protein [Planctomycetes bacterium]|nr:HIT family protein [Planctomycetota bacterium]
MTSIFTKIINGEIPSYKVWEDDRHYAFLDINPWVVGHTLIVPKLEVDYLFNMPDEAYSAFQLAAKTVANLLQERLGCVRVCVNVMGYEVPHVHIHLLPTNTIQDFANPADWQLKPKPDFDELMKKIAG